MSITDNNSVHSLPFRDSHCRVTYAALKELILTSEPEEADAAFRLILKLNSLERNMSFKEILDHLQVSKKNMPIGPKLISNYHVIEFALKEYILSTDPDSADLAAYALKEFRSICDNI